MFAVTINQVECCPMFSDPDSNSRQIIYVDTDLDGVATAINRRKANLTELAWFLSREYPVEFRKFRPRFEALKDVWGDISDAPYYTHPHFRGWFSSKNKDRGGPESRGVWRSVRAEVRVREYDKRVTWRKAWMTHGRLAVKKTEAGLIVAERKAEKAARARGRN